MVSEDAQKSRRVAIIGISTFLLVAMVVGVTVMSLHQNGSPDDQEKETRIASTVKAVKMLCNPVDYKEECEDSLIAEAGNTTDARELIKLAFNITIRRIGDELKKTELMREVEKEPRAKIALDTCKELMDLSIEEFMRSLEIMGTFDLSNLNSILASLKVWLSGAVTYQDTCLDGFENTTSDAGKKMKDLLTFTMHMTSNALAIISDLSNAVLRSHSTEDGRQLMQFSPDAYVVDHENVHELPSWVDNAADVRRLLQSNEQKVKADVVVAKDGSGKYTTINEALLEVPKKNKKTFVIYIKEGIYQEYIKVTKKMRHVAFVGEGSSRTRITGNKSFMDGITTYQTPTVAVQGDYFVAINIGFENTAGPQNHQAVAIRVQADKTIFYKCSMDGYQDTLYAHAMRQYYRDCVVSGTIDFVFGDAVAVFQNCTFIVRKPMSNQQCIVTAQGRKELKQPSGIVIQGGSIVAEDKVLLENKAFLGRPWKNYSRTIFMDTFIGDLIEPAGYMPWQGPLGFQGMDTCFYAEYNNTGPGSDVTMRVKWPGIKNLTTETVAEFVPRNFFDGDGWIKATKVPYTTNITELRHNAI